MRSPGLSTTRKVSLTGSFGCRIKLLEERLIRDVSARDNGCQNNEKPQVALRLFARAVVRLEVDA
jgi:hypothetical protein